MAKEQNPPRLEDVIDAVVETVEKGQYSFVDSATFLSNPKVIYKEDVIAALLVTSGHYGDAAKLLHLQRNKLKDYVDRTPDVLLFRHDLFESAVDSIEMSHMKLALGGDGPAQRFVLNTLGKNRGYSVRNEVGGVDGGPIEYAQVDARTKLLGELDRLASQPGAGGGNIETDGQGSQ